MTKITGCKITKQILKKIQDCKIHEHNREWVKIKTNNGVINYRLTRVMKWILNFTFFRHARGTQKFGVNKFSGASPVNRLEGLKGFVDSLVRFPKHNIPLHTRNSTEHSVHIICSSTRSYITCKLTFRDPTKYSEMVLGAAHLRLWRKGRVRGQVY